MIVACAATIRIGALIDHAVEGLRYLRRGGHPPLSATASSGLCSIGQSHHLVWTDDRLEGDTDQTLQIRRPDRGGLRGGGL
jgi:hypothetical protein